jgi:hypothetical protein
MEYESQFDGMTDAEIAAETRGLHEFETSCENGWLRQAEYCPDVLDEVDCHDREGRS